MNWKDATTYSRGQGGKAPQTAWSIEAGTLKIYLTNNHRMYPGDWIMHCYELNIKEKLIGEVDYMDLEEAKAKALDAVEKKISSFMFYFKRLTTK